MLVVFLKQFHAEMNSHSIKQAIFNLGKFQENGYSREMQRKKLNSYAILIFVSLF